MYRVTVVHSYYKSDQPSGENVVVDTQVDALTRAGYEVQVVTRRSDEVGLGLGGAVASGFRVATGYGRAPGGLPSDAESILHLHNLFPNFPTAWLKAWRGPIVATMHNYRGFCASANLFRDGNKCVECRTSGNGFPAVKHGCYRGSRLASIPLAIATSRYTSKSSPTGSANQIITLSDRSRKEYLESGVDAAKLVVLPNYVVTPSISNENDRTGWGYVGRLTEDKGVVQLIEAWPVDQPLDVVGDGPAYEECLRASNGKLVTLRGTCPKSEISAYMSKWKGLLFSSRWVEVCPTVYLEAVAAGLPIITTEGNAVADMVIADSSGVVLGPSVDIKYALYQIAQRWDEFSSSARRAHAQKYTEEVWLAGIKEIYGRSLVANDGRR